MDGTKLRTILAIAVSLNTALMAMDLSGFDNPKLDTAYKVISLILQFIIVAITTYYNNDYTPEASIGTDVTHKLKDDPTLVVEVFDPDGDDPDDVDEEEPEEDEEAPEEDEGGETIKEGEA